MSTDRLGADGIRPSDYDRAIEKNAQSMTERVVASLLDCVVLLEKRVLDLESEVEKLQYD